MHINQAAASYGWDCWGSAVWTWGSQEEQESLGSAMGTRIESEGFNWPGRKRGTNDSPAEGGCPRFSKTRWQGRRALFTGYSSVSRGGMAGCTRDGARRASCSDATRLSREGAGWRTRGPPLLSGSGVLVPTPIRHRRLAMGPSARWPHPSGTSGLTQLLPRDAPGPTRLLPAESVTSNGAKRSRGPSVMDSEAAIRASAVLGRREEGWASAAWSMAGGAARGRETYLFPFFFLFFFRGGGRRVGLWAGWALSKSKEEWEGGLRYVSTTESETDASILLDSANGRSL